MELLSIIAVFVVYAVYFFLLFSIVTISAICKGAFWGLIPLICGLVKKKKGLAIGGFFACIGSALLLPIPLIIVSALFTILIFVLKD